MACAATSQQCLLCLLQVMEVIVNHVLQSVDSQMLCKLNIDLPGVVWGMLDHAITCRQGLSASRFHPVSYRALASCSIQIEQVPKH
jgi:hypothetical protein